MIDLEAFLEEVLARKASADHDPESGHGHIDGLCEDALRAVVDGDPNGIAAAKAVVMLLDTEEREGWRRWYA